MYRIDEVHYGFKLLFSGCITADEMVQWLRESRRLLQDVRAPFGVLVDMRELDPMSAEVRVYFEEGQRLYKQRGMRRSAVILRGSHMTRQFRRLARETGVNVWERYIDANQKEDFESRGEIWITHGIEP